MEQISYNNRAENDRTWAQLLPLLKAYQLQEFTDYSRFMLIGRYRVEHWQHDTASQCRIYAVMGSEELLVYREDKWVGGYAEYHNRDTIQGYQLEGPWFEELELERRDFNASIDAHLGRVRLAELRRRSLEDQSDAATIARFTEAFSE